MFFITKIARFSTWAASTSSEYHRDIKLNIQYEIKNNMKPQRKEPNWRIITPPKVVR